MLSCVDAESLTLLRWKHLKGFEHVGNLSAFYPMCVAPEGFSVAVSEEGPEPEEGEEGVVSNTNTGNDTFSSNHVDIARGYISTPRHHPNNCKVVSRRTCKTAWVA